VGEPGDTVPRCLESARNHLPPMKSVLAAIDFSPVSRTVVRIAAELARGIAGQLVVLHVVQLPRIISTDIAPLVGEALQLTAEVERSARRHLRNIQKRLADRGDMVETVCCQGPSVPNIIRQATELDTGYIVLGSHGHTAFHDLVMGSTTSGVLRRSPCPVVVVPTVRGKPQRHKTRRAASRRTPGARVS
jgi:universal stress protein A